MNNLRDDAIEYYLNVYKVSGLQNTRGLSLVFRKISYIITFFITITWTRIDKGKLTVHIASREYHYTLQTPHLLTSNTSCMHCILSKVQTRMLGEQFSLKSILSWLRYSCIGSFGLLHELSIKPLLGSGNYRFAHWKLRPFQP